MLKGSRSVSLRERNRALDEYREWYFRLVMWLLDAKDEADVVWAMDDEELRFLGRPAHRETVGCLDIVDRLMAEWELDEMSYARERTRGFDAPRVRLYVGELALPDDEADLADLFKKATGWEPNWRGWERMVPLALALPAAFSRGRAVVALDSMDLASRSGDEARWFFLYPRLIEAVVLLPAAVRRRAPGRPSSDTLLVMSLTDGVRGVRFYDLREGPTDPGAGFERLCPRTFGVDELLGCGAGLDYGTYDYLTHLDPGRRRTLEDLGVTCFAGAVLRHMRTGREEQAAGDCTYVSATDFESGLLSGGQRLPDGYLDSHHVPDHVFLRRGDVVFSRIGRGGDVTYLAEDPQGRVIPNDNVLVVRADPKRVYPPFLAAFLASDGGVALLRMRSSAARIPSITVSDVRGLGFPDIDMGRQRSIGDKYLMAHSVMRNASRTLMDARSMLGQAIEEAGRA